MRWRSGSLREWCRTQGHEFALTERSPGRDHTGAPSPAAGVGLSRPATVDRVDDDAPGHWGLAARGATVEAGAPTFAFPLQKRAEMWATRQRGCMRRRRQRSGIPRRPFRGTLRSSSPRGRGRGRPGHDVPDRERNRRADRPRAICRQVHPQFREVMQLLAIQARTRRATSTCSRGAPSYAGRAQGYRPPVAKRPSRPWSTNPTSRSPRSCSRCSEGIFLSLLWFIHEHAPDLFTREVARLTAQDEARHVAFGLAHLARHIAEDPALRARLAVATTAAMTRSPIPPASTPKCSMRSSCSPPEAGTITQSASAGNVCRACSGT